MKIIKVADYCSLSEDVEVLLCRLKAHCPAPTDRWQSAYRLFIQMFLILNIWNVQIAPKTYDLTILEICISHKDRQTN